MTATPQYILKRTAAGTIDLALALFVGLSIFSFVSIPVVNRFFDGDSLSASLVDKQIASFLFVADDITGNIAPAVSENYPEAMYRFYVLSEWSELDTAEAYYDDILLRGQESCLFDFIAFIPNPEAPWIVPFDESQQVAVQSFYALKFQTAIDAFQDSPDVVALQEALSQRLVMSLVMTLLLLASPFYVIVPIFHSDGATLGQQLLKLRHIDAFGRPLQKVQILIKGFATLFFLGVGSLVALPFISYLLMVFHPRHLSIPDYFAVTRLIDSKDVK